MDEISPEMIEAGASAFWALPSVGAASGHLTGEEVAEAVYRAMIAARKDGRDES